jgi:hypothetical protein
LEGGGNGGRKTAPKTAIFRHLFTGTDIVRLSVTRQFEATGGAIKEVTGITRDIVRKASPETRGNALEVLRCIGKMLKVTSDRQMKEICNEVLAVHAAVYSGLAKDSR